MFNEGGALLKEKKVVSIENRIPTLKEHRRRKANRRLIILISMFFLLILCIIYFQSPLSDIQKITVEGNTALNKKKIIKIAGLQIGENIWSSNRKKAKERLEERPEIKTAQVKLVLPRTIEIQIKEHKKVAYIEATDRFKPVLENGDMLHHDSMTKMPVDAPILISFQDEKILKEMIDQLKGLPEEITNAMSEIHHAPKNTDKYHITIYMNDGYEVSATMRTFSDKIIHYPSIVSQLDANVKGVIDLEVGSFFKVYDPKGDIENEEDGR